MLNILINVEIFISDFEKRQHVKQKQNYNKKNVK